MKISLNFKDLILIPKLPAPRLNRLPIFFMTKQSASPIVKNLTIGHSLLWSQSSTRQENKTKQIEKQEASNSLKIL